MVIPPNRQCLGCGVLVPQVVSVGATRMCFLLMVTSVGSITIRMACIIRGAACNNLPFLASWFATSSGSHLSRSFPISQQKLSKSLIWTGSVARTTLKWVRGQTVHIHTSVRFTLATSCRAFCGLRQYGSVRKTRHKD
jgi:hypothetical protein